MSEYEMQLYEAEHEKDMHGDWSKEYPPDRITRVKDEVEALCDCVVEPYCLANPKT